MTKYRSNRKTTPKVKNGRVQKKNRHRPTRNNSLFIKIDRSSDECRVVLTKDEIWKFLRLVPDWKRVSIDLDEIYLCAGYYEDEIGEGVYEYPRFPAICLDGWNKGLRKSMDREYFQIHCDIFERFGVAVENVDGTFYAQFTENSAKAYQLLHIFLHELGHHHYRITKGWGKDAGNEKYAENYAKKMERKIWPRYCEAFGFDPKKELMEAERIEHII